MILGSLSHLAELHEPPAVVGLQVYASKGIPLSSHPAEASISALLQGFDKYGIWKHAAHPSPNLQYMNSANNPTAHCTNLQEPPLLELPMV